MFTTNNPVPGKTWEEQQTELLKLPGLILKKAPLGIWQIKYNTEGELTNDDAHKVLEIPKELQLMDFLELFFQKFNREYYTVSENLPNEIYCHPWKRRSLIDVFLITRKYFPNVTLQHIASGLLYGKNIGTSLCDTIYRRVYYLIDPDNKVNHIENETALDEFGRQIPYYPLWLNRIHQSYEPPAVKLAPIAISPRVPYEIKS